MRPKLTPTSYVSAEQYAREKNFFYQQGWHYLGLRQELASPGSYTVHNIWGHSVFKQLVGADEVKVYTNVCPHRYSRLRCNEGGHEPLVCPYHGWAFDPKDGKAIGIPDKPQFCFTEDDEALLSLEAWQVQLCGNLVFAAREPGQSLEDHLGGAFNSLETMSLGFGEKIDTNIIDIAANWKVVVENTLESYHVRKIHPESFFELGASGVDFRFDGHHSAWTADLSDKTKKKAKLLNKLFSDRSVVHDHYEHTLVFPNLTFATTFGLSFSVQEVIPLSESRTRFVSHVYFSKSDVPRPNLDTAKASIVDSIVQFNRQVFQEDKDICEAVQLGSMDAPHRGFLSTVEKRVEAFQIALVEVLS